MTYILKTNLIGISGKKGSGKDTVGNIIGHILSFKYKNNYRIKKFADKLKDITCLLLGCNREDLENEEFKNKELGEEWWYYKIYTGKNYNSIPYDGIYPEALLVKLTPRLLLQLLGTECGRQIIHPNIWINSLFADYKPFKKDVVDDIKNFSKLYVHNSCKGCKKPYSGRKRQYLCADCIENKEIQFYPNWIITDVRFPNEVKAIEERGGVVIRIERPGIILDNHESETALDNYKFKYTINNDGTIDELRETLNLIL